MKRSKKKKSKLHWEWEDKEALRVKDLSKMIDDKFKKNLVTYRSKKEHLAKFIFWFSNEQDKTPDDQGYVFDIPKKSRSIKDGFSLKEEKDLRKLFLNSKSKIKSVKFDNGYQTLEHPTKLLEKIFRTGKGHGPKITKTAVKLKYLFPPEDLFYWGNTQCQSNDNKKWNCYPHKPILCVIMETTFILEKKNIKDAIIDMNYPYSLVDDYGQVYHGPGSTQWENSELDIDLTNWGKHTIEGVSGQQGDLDGVYKWKEGGFHFGLNEKCFKILF